MRISGRIVTVGLCPSWDAVYQLEGIDWGQHKTASSCVNRPAGKALNISRALAWMGQTNIAAGLWGRDDYEKMLKAMSALKKRVKVELTAVDGGTRRNVTVVDTAAAREMHLRSRSELASTKALKKLHADLRAIVRKHSVCVFAGKMPGSELMGDVIRIIESCRSRGARIVLDTSGPALSQIVRTGTVWLIKPNVEELCELLGEQVRDAPVSLAKAGRKLLDRVEVVLISRGKKGAIVVTRKGAWRSRSVGRGRVLATVGCGDYLLAGFLKGLKDYSGTDAALKTAIKVATAKAWGREESTTWPRAKRQIKVETDGV
jgi:1-phosphofructokinase